MAVCRAHGDCLRAGRYSVEGAQNAAECAGCACACCLPAASGAEAGWGWPADVMYIREAVRDLVSTLAAVASERTEVLLAHGRNCFAEEEFMDACGAVFLVQQVGGEELDEVFQCSDVKVLRLTRKVGTSAEHRPDKSLSGKLIPTSAWEQAVAAQDMGR
jgi:hypothetical protein